MNTNLHTHTFRCGHASGTEREYIETAISGGIKVMGFSEHIPFAFPDGSESGYRMKIKDVPDYFETLTKLKNEYKDKIDIKIGFEMEYYPIYFDKMLANAKSWGAEYLILGQHFIGNEHPGGTYSGGDHPSADQLTEYVDCVVEAIKSGVFTYVAHPDLFDYSADDQVYISQMRRICQASKEHGVPLEINFLGIRGKRNYPKELFWTIAGEVGSPVVYGFDAHSAVDAYDPSSLIYAEKLVKENNLQLIHQPTIRALK